MKPTFVDIGPGRSGSSWLHQILESHPEICMGRSKETDFFNVNYARGFDWYESFFSDCSTATSIGEISNNYYLDQKVADLIYEYRPEMKLIMHFREPFSLLESFYGFGIRRGLDLGNVAEDLKLPIGMFMGSGYDARLARHSLAASDQLTLFEAVLLWTRFQPFLERFRRQNIYFFIFERLSSEARQLTREVYDFLGVESSFLPDSVDRVVNRAVVPRVRFLAPWIKKTGYILRRTGMYRLLTALHRSERLKAVFFRKGARPSLEKSCLDSELVRLLAEDRKRLLGQFPVLRGYWDRDFV